MKNIYRKEKNELAYRFNLQILSEKYNEVVTTFQSKNKFNKPCLFIRGSKSNYITTEDEVLIKQNFTNTSIETIPEAGHWLHAEQPQEFYLKTMQFC